MHRFTGWPLETWHAKERFTAKERSKWFRTTPRECRGPREDAMHDAVDENTEIQWTMMDIESTFTSEYTRGSGWTTATPGEHPTVEDSVDEDKGDGGSKVCLLCKNVFSGQSQVADEDGDAASVLDDARRFRQLCTVQYKRKADKITHEPPTQYHQDHKERRMSSAWSSMVLRGLNTESHLHREAT